MLDPQQSVAALVLDHSECAPVFQRHRIDYCCKGEQSIEAASAKAGIGLPAIMEQLAQAISARQGGPASDPRALSTPVLVAHLITRYHEPLRQALAFTLPLAAKVARVHGEHNPKLIDLSAVVQELHDALLPHLDTEEQSLFPLLMAIPVDPARAARELASMQEEHLEVAAQLERLHRASDDFTVPEWACNSYKTLFSELERLEVDLLAHVHLENHVLRPRFSPL